MQKILLPAWPITLLAALAAIFFAGGVYLEIEAADHGIKAILEADLDERQLKDALSFQGERVKGIQQAATTALDISKICLGALVATISQYLGGRRQNSSSQANES
jgi:hypothetical protein